MSKQAYNSPYRHTSMREIIDSFDWSKTPLGPSHAWPPELKTAVNMMLGVDAPVAIYWGNDLVMLYNDSWSQMPSVRDSEAIGEPARKAYADNWLNIGPLLANAMAGQTTRANRGIKSPAESGGDQAWSEFQMTPLRYADGSIGGIMHNVHGPRRNQDLRDALHEASERNHFLERALAHMGDYVYVWDRNKKFVYVNKQLERLWGRPKEEYLGKTMADIGYPPKLEDLLNRQIDQVLMTRESVTGLTPYTSPTGTEGYYEYILNPLIGPNGVVQFVAGVSRDVAERHRAGEALRKSEQRYRTLFESIDEGFCVFEMLFNEQEEPVDYRWLEINPAFERHTGLKNAIGRTAREMVPNLESHWLQIYGRIALTGKQERFVEHSPAMGRWFEVDAFRIGDPEERKVALLFADITQRKETEQALKEADQRKDEFLATLAHELRNPLAAIRSGVEIMKLAQDEPSVLLDTYNTMERQTQQLVSLVDDLLEVSRVTRGTLELRKSRIQLTDIVTSAIESCQPLLAKTDHTLTLDLPSHAVELEADPNRCAQVLSNLLNNAAKYTPAGGDISLSARIRTGEVAISVKDTGIGIAAERLDDIFQMFSQVEGNQVGDYQGLGVGLALAKSLVEMHGGRISVTSGGIGQGSEFTVSLPIVEVSENESAPEVEDTTAEVISVSGGHRVLVVDDNIDAASTLSMLISMLGNNINTAHSGREAVELAGDFRPEVIFMDIGMPEMDGLEATRQIRKQPWGEDILIVALSGWGQDEDKRKSKEAGFDHHLVKPTQLAELQQVLSQLDQRADALCPA